MSTTTRCPSSSEVRPARCKAEACTNTSLPPPSRTIKPKPFVELYHLTAPFSDDVALSGARSPARALRDAHLQRFARLHRRDAEAPQHRRVQKRIPRAVRQLDEAEALFRFEPFDDALHRPPRRVLAATP